MMTELKYQRLFFDHLDDHRYLPNAHVLLTLARVLNQRLLGS